MDTRKTFFLKIDGELKNRILSKLKLQGKTLTRWIAEKIEEELNK
jgi:predicted HicB family RNase H-like nuclease